jgi:ankyrin repeat protein
MKASLLILLVLLAGCRDKTEPEVSEPELVVAAEQGDLKRLDRLLSSSKSPDVRDSCRWTPLMKAANNGHLEAVRRLLLTGADVNLTDKGGYSALHLAAANNHLEIVRLLLTEGAEINIQEQTNGWTPLLWAAKRGHAEIVGLLLQQGADSQLTDHKRLKSLDWAMREQHQKVMDLLNREPTEITTR